MHSLHTLSPHGRILGCVQMSSQIGHEAGLLFDIYFLDKVFNWKIYVMKIVFKNFFKIKNTQLIIQSS
jgi:hypothetical protein